MFPLLSHVISHVLYFPLRKWQPFIYILLCPGVLFGSILQVPLPNLGFSLAGFTRSICTVSHAARLCGTFTEVFP